MREHNEVVGTVRSLECRLLEQVEPHAQDAAAVETDAARLVAGIIGWLDKLLRVEGNVEEAGKLGVCGASRR